jgi:hypothetical protein
MKAIKPLMSIFEENMMLMDSALRIVLTSVYLIELFHDTDTLKSFFFAIETMILNHRQKMYKCYINDGYVFHKTYAFVLQKHFLFNSTYIL